MSVLDPAWAIETLIAATLLMGFVLAVRKLAQRALGPQLAYWLWALPALRMALPPLPASWREATATPLAVARESVGVYLSPAVAATPDPAGMVVPWLLVGGALWALGAIAFFAWHSAAHLSYVRRIVSPPATHERLADGTTLVESDEAVGPVAFGVWRRFIAVPRDFAERWDADERRLALSHELGHHARGDLVANWIALAVLALHWWNPVAWFAYRKFRGDQEMANDARVLADLPAIERHAYACAIVKAAHGRAVTAACHLHTIEDLKGRLRMLKAGRKSARVLAAGAVGIGTLTVAGLGITASCAAAEQIRHVTEKRVGALTTGGIRIGVGALPAVAQAPAAVPAPAPGATPPAATATPKRTRRVTITRDGETHIYEGAEAEQYLAANPVPPLPPLPPVVTAFGPSRLTVLPRDKDGKLTAVLARSLAGSTEPLRVTIPNVTTSDRCVDKGAGTTTRTETRDGRSVTVICTNLIERLASNSAMSGLRSALSSLRFGRMAIERDRNLDEAKRAKALSEIDRTRAELERQLADNQD